VTLAERIAAAKPQPKPDPRPEWMRRAQEHQLPARVSMPAASAR
jgi:hypothetical protein